MLDYCANSIIPSHQDKKTLLLDELPMVLDQVECVDVVVIVSIQRHTSILNNMASSIRSRPTHV